MKGRYHITWIREILEGNTEYTNKCYSFDDTRCNMNLTDFSLAICRRGVPSYANLNVDDDAVYPEGRDGDRAAHHQSLRP